MEGKEKEGPCGLFCFPICAPLVELGLGWSPGRMDEWRWGGLTDAGQDWGNGHRIGQRGNECEGRLAGGTDQGEGIIDPGQEGRSGISKRRDVRVGEIRRDL